LLMILFTSSGHINSIMMDNTDFVKANLNNHPIYLISTNNINGLLFCSNLFLTFLSFVISIDLVYISCAIMLYIGTRIEALFSILSDQLSANCLSASAFSKLVVLILRSLLFD